MPRHEVIAVRGENGAWVIETRDRDSKKYRFQARVLVNAAGPWVSSLTDSVIDGAVSRSMRLIRGSHIVVPKLYAHDRCYLLQNSDDRIVFVIPYEEEFSLIGTTDREHQESLNQVTISEDEAQYLCESVNDYFNSSITLEDIVWTYSAIRPLFDDGNADADNPFTFRLFAVNIKDSRSSFGTLTSPWYINCSNLSKSLGGTSLRNMIGCIWVKLL